jgi:rhamnose utilization protein RhaD (predicted bifunctional aldolase and dehydrogenase)
MPTESDDFEEALGNQTRASEWKTLRLALVERLRNLRDSQTATSDPDELIRLARQIEILEAQVETIRIEEAVADFVEKSVRYTINSNKMLEQSEDEP